MAQLRDGVSGLGNASGRGKAYHNHRVRFWEDSELSRFASIARGLAGQDGFGRNEHSNDENGNSMRPGQHKQRGRSRNRHHGGGSSSGGGGGGNPLSRIYDSNGPDVKVRGTAQTVAEKYLQLGRDAQVSGDIVMAESYYQFAEHYLRIVAAAQAYQQQMQSQLRRPGEEFDDDGQEGEAEDGQAQAAIPPGLSDQPDAAAPQAAPDGERQPQNFRPRDQQGGRERFRPRWQDRSERQPPAGQPRPAEQPRAVQPGNGNGEAAEPGQWEAPSFLRRPAPLPPAEAGEEQPQRRPRHERRPRPEGAEAAAEPDAPVPPVGD